MKVKVGYITPEAGSAGVYYTLEKSHFLYSGGMYCCIWTGIYRMCEADRSGTCFEYGKCCGTASVHRCICACIE